MMIGETHRYNHHQAPPWPESSPPLSPTDNDYASIMAYFLKTGEYESVPALDSGTISNEMDLIMFPSSDDDEFFMYEFKVRKCTRARAHDWTECPFAHPGEKARRRDPRKYSYSGTACSDFRKGGCKKGDACEFAHGVFECWLHPTRYRTQACKDGSGCRRRVCFFAHRPDQLRPGSGSPRGSQHSCADSYPDDGVLSVGSGSGSPSVSELIASLRNLQLSKVKSMPNSWAGGPIQVGSPVFGSPRGGGSPALTRSGFFSLPTTPTRPGSGYLDMWDNNKDAGGEETPVMERVESGRALRARMFEKLSKENPLHRPGTDETSGPGYDLGWVSDLIK